MCFNANTSFITFTISLVCFVYLLNRGLKTKNKNDIFLSTLTILIGMIQLVEYFIWSNQDCNNINHYFSLCMVIVFYLQGAVTSLVYFKLYPENPLFSKNFIKSVLLLYLIFIIYILYRFNTYKLCSKPSPNTCRLVWDIFVKMNYPKNRMLLVIYYFFYIFIFFSILANSVYSGNTLLTEYPFRYLFLYLTYCLSVIYILLTSYYTKEIYSSIKKYNLPLFMKKMLQVGSNDVFGSVWCFLAVFVGIVGILKI